MPPVRYILNFEEKRIQSYDALDEALATAESIGEFSRKERKVRAAAVSACLTCVLLAACVFATAPGGQGPAFGVHRDDCTPTNHRFGTNRLNRYKPPGPAGSRDPLDSRVQDIPRDTHRSAAAAKVVRPPKAVAACVVCRHRPPRRWGFDAGRNPFPRGPSALDHVPDGPGGAAEHALGALCRYFCIESPPPPPF